MFNRFLIALMFLVLAGCSGPETPQEVAEAFWQSVAENDGDDVAELSTLDNADDFDGFERGWENVVPEFGRMVIEDAEATIVTKLPPAKGDKGGRTELVTYLVQGDQGWRVDYQRTREALMNPSPFGKIMGELGKLKDKFEASFNSSSEDLESGMKEFAREFEAYSEELEREAQDAMEDFGETLQEAMEDLAESINDALEDDDQMPGDDRVILEEAALDLESNSESLDDADVDTLARASNAMARTGKRFSRLSEDTFERYREDWKEALAEIRAETDSFFVDLRQRSGKGS